jgi:thiol:disulfide interchange protein
MKALKIFLYIVIYGIALAFNAANAETLSAQNDKVAVSIYTQYRQINDVKNFSVLIKFQLLNGWHIAWDNAGDAGTPTKFSWQAPKDISIARLNESVPEKFLYGGILTQFGYGNKAYYLFSVKASADFTSDTELKLKINLVACKDFCEPYEPEFTINPPPQAEQNILAPDWQSVIEQAQKTFPEQAVNTAYVQNQNGVIKIIFPDADFVKNAVSVYFVPYRQNIITADSKQSISFNNNQLEIQAEAEDEYLIPQKGLLIYDGKAIKYNVLPMNLYHQSNNIYILLLAFLGGLILNFMPCVFPILSLKAVSLAKSAAGSKHFKNGLLYLSGVMCCFAIIAALLYFLRLSGNELGWGFQLQSPIFVGIMLVIFSVLGLMMLDVIKWRDNSAFLNTLTRLSGINSFLTGFFAVLIASPCTGPFMGAAIGYAMLQPQQLYFPIFLSLGLGYALPFTLLEIYPNLIRRILPKSGYWTMALKKILAIPMFLTCLWLGWILYHQLKAFEPKQASAVWQQYNPQTVQNLIDDGEPVFIDFTAKWCITCLMNEKTSLDTANFEALARQHNINLFKADWTNRDEQIAAVIKQYGRSGVPLYVYYPPHNQNPVILPQILTPNIIRQHLNGQN